jgi:hypothetical protein
MADSGQAPQGRLKIENQFDFMSFISAYFHCVFSTKERRPHHAGIARSSLAFPWRYRAAEQNEGHRNLRRGNHVHILLSLPTTISISKAMQLI